MTTTPPWTVLVVDDHPAMRDGVARLLDADPDLTVVGRASDGAEALLLADALNPHVVLLDVDLPGRSGVEVARDLSASHPATRVLAFSAHETPAFTAGLFQAGAAGYLTKDTDLKVLADAVKAVAAGQQRWFVRPSSLLDVLTAREQDVLRRLAVGRSNLEIASDLNLSESTVRNHLTNVYAKLGVASSREAVAWAWKHGLGDA